MLPPKKLPSKRNRVSRDRLIARGRHGLKTNLPEKPETERQIGQVAESDRENNFKEKIIYG